METNSKVFNFDQEDLNAIHDLKEFYEFMNCEEGYPEIADKLEELSDVAWLTLLSYREYADAPFPSELLTEHMLERIADGKIVLSDDPLDGVPTKYRGIYLVIHDEEPP